MGCRMRIVGDVDPADERPLSCPDGLPLSLQQDATFQEMTPLPKFGHYLHLPMPLVALTN
jgi:hypothetical protein